MITPDWLIDVAVFVTTILGFGVYLGRQSKNREVAASDKKALKASSDLSDLKIREASRNELSTISDRDLVSGVANTGAVKSKSSTTK